MAELKFVEIRLDRLAELLKVEDIWFAYCAAGVDNWDGVDNVDYESIGAFARRVDDAVADGTLTPDFG